MAKIIRAYSMFIAGPRRKSNDVTLKLYFKWPTSPRWVQPGNSQQDAEIICGGRGWEHRR